MKRNRFKAWEATVKHELGQVHKVGRVFSHSKVPLDDHGLKQLEGRSIGGASQNVYEFLGQLEGSRLKPHILARRPVENKSEVNVDQVPIFVDQNIAVVSVLNLQDKRDDSVGSKGPYEVVAGKFKLCGGLGTVSLEEILMKIDFKSFAELVTRVRVWDYFNDAAKGIF